jgi:signal transduction histidine kinase
MNQKAIDGIIGRLRALNKDEFVPNLTNENTLENLLEELHLLESKNQEEKKLRNAIVDHLHHNMAGNLYEKFPAEQFNYEFQILGEGINAYIDELEINTINKENFNLILTTLPERIFVFDYKNYIFYANCEGEPFLNEKVIKKYFQLDEFIPKGLLEKIEAFKIKQKSNSEFHFSYKNKLQETIHLEINLIHIDFEQKKQILLIAKDITLQKNAELDRLKAIILGQDQERKRLASDLHDSLGQELGAIKFFIGSLSLMQKDSTEYLECLEEIDRMVNDSISSVREITFDLMPFVLENNTLNKAIEQLCNQTNTIHPLHVHFSENAKKIVRKDKKEEAIIYRIVQEFFNNTIKHAHAEHLYIKLEQTKEQLTIQLIDDGTGFELHAVQKNNGLRNITQRLEVLQAEYAWESNTTDGTSLTFTLYEKN